MPTEMPKVKIDEIMQAMQHDKKIVDDKIRFVLLKSIGDAFVSDEVSPSLVKEVLAGDE